MLPKSYKPDGSFDLIRLGSDNDGGYLVDPKSIENSVALLGRGMPPTTRPNGLALEPVG